MTLTPRRRAVIAILVSWPLGYIYLYWGVYTGYQLFRHYKYDYVSCDNWRSQFNGCSGYSATLAWGELIVTTAVIVGIAALTARWVVLPVRTIADTVGRFGPTSLGLRINHEGPKDETRRLSDEIDSMLDRLGEGYEAQRRFASNASHELRTPLATQRALIEVSLNSALTEDQLELLSRQLLATNERNEKLVDGLLTLAETERGLMANTPLRLDRIVGEAAEILRPAAKERDLEMSAVFAPVTIVGELPLLDRLASNLIFNAIKYNQPGGSVIVNVAQNGTFTVANTGPIVPPELVAGLFEPFRRMTGERLDHGGGVGLGLTIARSIVAAHGAEIIAQANPGGGLVVEVRFQTA
jgi:signal transduction histidine kinase